jgi:ribosomal protein S18 acetylase RimI-like enzyme
MADSVSAAGYLDTPNLSLEWTEVPWDSVLFGFPVLQIGRIEVRSPAAENDFAAFEAFRDRLQTGLVSCRLPHQCLNESMCLEARGFRFIEMVYHPEIDDLQAKDLGTSTGLKVSRAGSLDLPVVQDIAGHAFHNERFHVDPRLDARIADQRYKNWATNSFNHPSQELYCARDAQRVLAFFVTEMLADGTCYWHLNAVAPDSQGKGFGALAWRAMMHHARDAGAKRVRTCIAARNHRVLNLYCRLGFRVSPPDMTFHWVKERPLG